MGWGLEVEKGIHKLMESKTWAQVIPPEISLEVKCGGEGYNQEG